MHTPTSPPPCSRACIALALTAALRRAPAHTSARTTHLFTQLCPHLLGHPLSHSDCRHSPRLCACDGTALGKAARQQELRYLCGLAAPGLPHQHEGLVVSCLEVTITVTVDRGCTVACRLGRGCTSTCVHCKAALRQNWCACGVCSHLSKDWVLHLRHRGISARMQGPSQE